MLDKLKADFDVILELVNKCPSTLQETALKMILDQWFISNVTPSTPPAKPAAGAGKGGGGTGDAVHDAIKRFLTANAITDEILEKAFHPTGPGAQLSVSQIAGSGKATKQANLAVLLAVRQALETGSFTCTLKELREMAVHYDCYDSANFSANLKSYKNYFKPREKGAELELSGPGLKKAGDLIKAIAAAASSEA